MRTHTILIILILIFSNQASADGLWTTHSSDLDIGQIAFDGRYLWYSSTGHAHRGFLVRWDQETDIRAEFLPKTDYSELVINDIVTHGLEDIWLATNQGVMHYNGSIWKTYSVDDGLSAPHIYCITIDNDGIIWVGNDNWDHEPKRYVSSFDGVLWTNYTLETGDRGGIRKIVVDSNNVKWILQQFSLVRFDGETWTEYPMEYLDLDYRASFFMSIVVDKNNVVWLPITGTQGDSMSSFEMVSSLLSFDGVEWKEHQKKASGGEAFRSYIVLHVDDNNVLWYNDEAGIVSFDGVSYQNYPFNLRGFNDYLYDATAAIIDNGGLMWVVIKYFSEFKYLAQFDGYRFTDLLFGPEGNAVNEVEVSDDGIVWAVNNDKITRFDGSLWHYIGNSGLFNIASIAIQNNGSAWFGASSALGRYRDDTLECLYYTEINISACLFERSGWLWLGMTEGIRRIDVDELPPDISAVPVEHEANNVREIVEDFNSIIWFGTDDNGLIRFDGMNWETITMETSGLISNIVTSIAVDQNNVKWIGTPEGVSRYDGESWETITTENSGIASDRVNAIAVDLDNVVWFGTDNGVSRFGGSDWKTYTYEDGLIDNNVLSVAVGPDNVKWFGTSYGVSSFEERIITHAVEESLPREIIVLVNHPNPFNPSTTISYTLPGAGHVQLSVYDITGRKLAILVDGYKQAGKHSAIFDGSRCASGVYFYQIQSKKFGKSGKMLLMK